MPRYDYLCQKCKKTFEVTMTYNEKDKGLKPKCPTCNSSKDVIQVFGNIGIVSRDVKKTGTNNPPSSCNFSGGGCGCCG